MYFGFTPKHTGIYSVCRPEADFGGVTIHIYIYVYVHFGNWQQAPSVTRLMPHQSHALGARHREGRRQREVHRGLREALTTRGNQGENHKKFLQMGGGGGSGLGGQNQAENTKNMKMRGAGGLGCRVYGFSGIYNLDVIEHTDAFSHAPQQNTSANIDSDLASCKVV